ncbi:hypothetical protein PANO111632_17895 [Paracoccus nototheniae]
MGEGQGVTVTDKVEQSGLATQMDAATRRVVGPDMPSRLQSITDAHLSRLIALVQTMQAAGIDDSLVRHSIHELVASYEAELVDVMTALAQTDR